MKKLRLKGHIRSDAIAVVIALSFLRYSDRECEDISQRRRRRRHQHCFRSRDPRDPRFESIFITRSVCRGAMYNRRVRKWYIEIPENSKRGKILSRR